jgi:hypothetical protein
MLIGPVTWEHVAEETPARRLPPVRVKGKSEPLTVYEVRHEGQSG